MNLLNRVVGRKPMATCEQRRMEHARAVVVVVLAAALLLMPLGMRAQEESEAEAEPSPAKSAVARPKTAIELGAPFGDHAILQREMPVPVWGWSKPGTQVTVAFAGQKKTATAGQDGKWMVQLDPLTASATPAEMVISDTSGKKVILKDLLVGEVWLASGQSNMQLGVQKTDCAKLRVEAKGNVVPIREFEVTSVYAALHPIEHASGAWKNGEYGNYSAIAFAFAHKLYGELGVPIGILNCSFSQTAIQAWVPRVGFRDGKDEYTQAIYRQILETDPTTPEHKAAWNQFYQEIEATLKANTDDQGEKAKAISTKTPGNLHGNRDASWMFNGRLNPVIPYALRGAIWNQGYANAGEGLPYYNNLHSLVRGWRLVWDKPELPVYFHQFYCPGEKKGWDNSPSIGSTAEMRLGTWLARDIPNVGMASQIDITGAVHYRNKAVAGQRLALQALKNQYGRKIVADGPMFKSYEVKGDKLSVDFDFAEGGLVVAETGSTSKDIAIPTLIENGDGQVKLFYLADENRVWYPASLKIEGNKVVVWSPKVKAPRGVSYGTGGIGFQPNLYNRALLPMTPFIYYDHKLVTSQTWPDKELKINGVAADPTAVGKVYEYRKMPLLSAQFRDNAVFQAGMPVTIWGSAVHDWGYEAKGKAEILFSFAGIEKTIPVTPGMREWQATVPAMEASAEPKTLKVRFTIDGELAHERICTNIVIGDVWYVAASGGKGTGSGAGGLVRVMTRSAKRSTSSRPSRYSVSVSTTPDSRYASEWENAEGGLAGALGARIHEKTGKPVGIIYMSGDVPELKYWIAPEDLQRAPSLMDDYKQLAALTPGTAYYAANARRYVADWKKYWGDFIPQMMATKAVPNGAAWGSYPSFSSAVTTEASQAYNVMVHPFWPGSFKGILFMCSKTMFEKDQGADFGPELAALANGWKRKFGCPDPFFCYTVPSQTLAPKLTRPAGIKGRSVAIEIGQWPAASSSGKRSKTPDTQEPKGLIDQILSEVYK